MFTAEVNEGNPKEVPPLKKLPKRPVKPIQPKPYRGAKITDMQPVTGYGLLSAGKINIFSHYGVKKFFGVAGQGSRVSENLSFTLNNSNTKGKCDSKDVKRFYLLSVYPKIKLDSNNVIQPMMQKAERLKFTVQGEFINSEFDFSLPASTTGVSDPVKPPSEKKIAEYYKSFEDSYAQSLESGSSKLLATASASLVALAALTLY